MSYLSMTNIFMKTHRFLQDPTPPSTTTTNIPQTRNLLLTTSNKGKTIQQVWSQYNFDTSNIDKSNLDDNKLKMSWTISCNNNNNNNNNNDIKEMQVENDISVNKEATVNDEIAPSSSSSPPPPPNLHGEKEKSPPSISPLSPSHHARRPPNAFLIFCKKHRPIVRSKYSSLENRGVTKILGEWWALLDDSDKAPYTQLAKEYKDAFLSANPDFKWYKLPAPPLRTLNVRPNSNNNCNVHKVLSPISSPIPSNNLQVESEFTPGKLADESQLGNLTSLMNNNNNTTTNNSNNYTTISPKSTIINENNNNNNNLEKSPINFIQTHLPPAPIKKRISQKYLNNDNNTSNVARKLLKTNISGGEFCNNIDNDDDNNNNNNQIECDHNYDDDDDDNDCEFNDSSNMTNQELMNKVVDKLFTKNNQQQNSKRVGLRNSKGIRKSGRQCKGKRYEKFMSEGRLFSNKRDNKLFNRNDSSNDNRECDEKIDNELNLKLDVIETPNLDHTIKRLAERTNMKNLLIEKTSSTDQRIIETTNGDDINNNHHNNDVKVTAATPTVKTANDFNLDLRISMLPSLSYDIYSQRKKDSKKRKNRFRTNYNNNNIDDDNAVSDAKIPKTIKNEQPVGSKKRKNKHSITHLENKQQQQQNNCNDSINNDLLGLATLAEVAANTQKINEEIVLQ